MKNIHILPTENSSRLSYNKDGVLELHRLQWRKNNQHIYITSDEEIKEGDWVLFMFNEVTEIVKVTTIVNNAFDSKEGFGYGLEYCKKIILTTDQPSDSVQAIDDEFLEWFVKNPSCEEVEVEGHIYKGQDETEYKINIPQEEQQDKKLYSEEDLDMFRKFMIQEQNFSKSCLDVFIEQFKKK
jgi:hypothetical protein